MAAFLKEMVKKKKKDSNDVCFIITTTTPAEFILENAVREKTPRGYELKEQHSFVKCFILFRNDPEKFMCYHSTESYADGYVYEIGLWKSIASSSETGGPGIWQFGINGV
ncbi:hypothetical protein CEXT_705551 [Caerostris extrusa]|uniref:Uncharacterized protein n=1 Tax=Caerostris extrusa TaxID=172846 RepID=A0AAV4Q871_CAEEX|nr:hypothetical protein CEXT_705551 [Caerostris extrusa]